MLRLLPRLLAGASLTALGFSAPALASDAALDADRGALVEEIQVTAAHTRTSAVTGLDLSLRETPQSVTIIHRDRIEDFGLTDVNQLLAQVTGVNVEKVETDRTYYNSRGFDITNFQVDGIGLPLIWGIQFGDLDTVLFDRVETVRGANSMMTGAGNPSATVNYVRKRPTAEFQASGALGYGSWDEFRAEADVSGPLTASGAVSGRLIYANTDRGSHLDYYGVNRNVYSSLVEWAPTDRLTATLGYALQDNRAQGNLWGALPLVYSDGTRVDYPRSASTSAEWTHWNVRDETLFGEVAYDFGGGWMLKAVATYKRFREHAELLYAYGAPDPDTGLGVFGMAGIYPSFYQSYILDAYAAGPFEAFGRTHQLVVGGQASRSNATEYENFSTETPVYGDVRRLGDFDIPRPSYPGAYLSASEDEKLYRVYAAAHLSLTDRLKFVAGLNALKLRTTGFSYGSDMSRDEEKVSPYLGAVYDLTPNISAYASYTDIFNPQSEQDAAGEKLPAAHGRAYEAGLKSEWFDRRLYLTAAVFQSEQSDLAEYAGMDPATGRSIYEGIDVEVRGYELEATGALTDRLTVSAGWTQLDMDDDVRTYAPRRTFKATAAYVVPELRDLRLGAALRWQSKVSAQDIVRVEQDAYAVLDLMAGIAVTDRVRATVNVKNATDEKHLASLMWNQSYYAAPRSYAVRLDVAF